MLTLQNMQNQWPHGNSTVPGLLEGIAAAAPAVFPKYGLTTPLLVAHAMAQFSVECGQGTTMRENMNYSAERLLVVFRKYFTAETAAKWQHNPQGIAGVVYGGRMGNAAPPSNDGYNFRGAGLAQITGRNNATAVQKLLDSHTAGFNILQSPDLIVSAQYALESGVAAFINCGCLPFAQTDDVVGVTQKLNGGENGLPERTIQLGLWKKELGVA